MTYNEWRDELKNNLLTVSDAERKHVLDYYAEAYADRREAGFNERDIIEGFGAPYDAAQRILSESSDEYYHESDRSEVHKESSDKQAFTRHNEDLKEESEEPNVSKQEPRKKDTKRTKEKSSGNWRHVLLCVALVLTTLVLTATMVGLTTSMLVAPFGVLISGILAMVAGIVTIVYNLMTGIFIVGTGITLIGVGLILIPIGIKLFKLMWKLFKVLFKWLKQVCKGENA